MDILNQIQPIDQNTQIDFDYAKSFSSLNAPVAIKGIKGEILYMNESAKKLSSASNESIFVSYDEKLPEDIEALNELGCIKANKKIELKNGNGKTEKKIFHIESITLLNKFGLFYGTLFIFQDITPLINYICPSSGKSGKNNLVYDDITGMFLKNQFEEIFARETERSERYRFPLAVSVFYFENLIFFGQSFGSEKLNQVLKFIGIYFKQKLRKTDIVFRIDFNNFTGILPHTDYENAYKKFKKIKDEFSGMLKFPENVKPVLKFGISELNLKKHYKNYGLLIDEAKADIAEKNGSVLQQNSGYTF
jgi:diguanylate cyclase (GGDEF)-like protein